MVAPVIDIKHVQLGDDELHAVRNTLLTADLSGNAEVVGRYEQELTSWFDVQFAVACSSGTAAIHLALLALGIGPGAEVIVPATAPAMTALPVLAVGAVPVFADVAHPATFALDIADMAAKFTPYTKAVIAVPMWGYPADGPELAQVCRDWGVPLVEDAAQAHGTSLASRYAGTQGVIGTFSTHARKLICTGEGGFCLTGDPALADRLRQLRNFGQPPNGGEFGTGFGLNYKLPAVAAALGRVQLSRLTNRLTQRRTILSKLTTMAGVTVKHATASVFLLARTTDTWHIGLIRHPRLGKWMLPGGHVEPDENPAEAALREVAEETGHTAWLLPGPRLDEPDKSDAPSVITPLWIVEQHVPAERREPEPHIHVDHLYLALTDATAPAPGAELPFAWYTTHQLDALDMFGDTRARAAYLLDHIDALATATTYDGVLG
ncbi:MAG: DegT/DnrJ/EryC1/StrS family aminotransferase [Pseudonocardiales bacterium]